VPSDRISDAIMGPIWELERGNTLAGTNHSVPEGGAASCPVCGNWATQIGAASRCRSCQLLFRPSLGAQRLEKLHETKYFSDDPEFGMTPDGLLGQYLDFIEDHRPLAGSNVLDFGCGTGPIAPLIQGRGGRYSGVEPSVLARDDLERRKIAAFASLDDDGLGLGSYDLVLMIEVIEHLDRPYEILPRLREFLRPGGFIFISTPNARGARARLLGARWEQFMNPTHMCLYNSAALDTVLTQSGFRQRATLRRVNFGRQGAARQGVDFLLQMARIDGGLRVLAESRV
jgi:SAM-dependent methyltransferase